MQIEIDIIQNNSSWPEISGLLHKVTEATLKHFSWPVAAKQLEISFILTGNQEIKALNKEYRGKDKATNVLSFPNLELVAGDYSNIELLDGYSHLGDIVLSHQVIREEAYTEEKSFEHHLIHLIIHGLLHLIGFDHIKESDEKIMVAHEIAILKLFTIENPYQ